MKELKDQAILAEIAQTDSDFRVRMQAIKKLEDQEVLSRIVLSDCDSLESFEAICNQNLINPTTLAHVAINSKRKTMRSSAVEKIFDNAALAEISVNSHCKDTRLEAIEKLVKCKHSASPHITDVALKSTDSRVRRIAVYNIARTDQVSIKSIALGDYDQDIQQIAISKLDDIDDLSQIAFNHPDSTVRETAFKRMLEFQLDSNTLLRISMFHSSDVDGYHSYYYNEDYPLFIAISRLSDQAALAEIAKKHPIPYAKIKAIHRLTDRTVLEWIVQTDRSTYTLLEFYGDVDYPSKRTHEESVSKHAEKRLEKLKEN